MSQILLFQYSENEISLFNLCTQGSTPWAHPVRQATGMRMWFHKGKTHCETHDETHGETHCETHDDTHGDTHCETHDDTHSDTHSDTHGDTHGETHGDTHGETHGDTHSDTHGEIHGDTHGDIHGLVVLHSKLHNMHIRAISASGLGDHLNYPKVTKKVSER